MKLIVNGIVRHLVSTDVLEGLAQLFSTSLNGVHELIQVINIEVLKMLLVLVPKMLKISKTLLCPKGISVFLWCLTKIW